MFRPEPFRCDVIEGRASAVVAPHGELDLETVDEARAALRSVLTKPSVTLDLRRLSFIDSTGLRLILEIDAHARQDGFNFFVVRGGPDIQRVFEITGVGSHLAFIDAPEDLAPPT
jgi:anti-sigma B factor antagonist